MSRAVTERIIKSTTQFEELAWPRIREFLGGGELIPVESVTDNDFCEELDTRAGIDRWQLVADGESIRGIASRMQMLFGDQKAWRSFTIRWARRSGFATEWHKRMRAIDASPPVLAPHWVAQGYERGGVLEAVAVVNADSFYRYARAHVDDLRTRQNPEDGTLFKVVWWDQLLNLPEGHFYQWTRCT